MDIPPVPNQPKTFKFPQRSFGQKKNSEKKFQSSWFANRTWLHYDEANDLAYYHVWLIAYRDGKLNSSNLDKAFILNGFSNWKDASVAFKKHDSSRCHRDSVRGQNSCVQYVCVVRCSNITIIRNIFSNIPTKLTEFITRNCNKNAFLNLNLFRGTSPEHPLWEGETHEPWDGHELGL